jgi:hypothetical protein
MNDDKFNFTIKEIENYFFGIEEDCGEKLFIDFAKVHKEDFMKSRINSFTENEFQ